MPGHDQNIKPNDLFGVFHEETGVYVGEPYTKNAYVLSRHKGKTFLVPVQPSGTGRDAMIDKTTLLRVPGDIYIDPMVHKAEPKSKLHGKAFIPVGDTKKSSGMGSIYGLLGPAQDLLDTDSSLVDGGRAARKPDPASKKRNIYVTPAKKGSYGFPIQERSIGGTRFDFVPDEYCRGRILEKDMKRAARARIPKPFVSTGFTGKTLVPLPNTIPGEGPITRPPKSPRGASSRSSKPWKGTNPSPKGRGFGCLSSIPYIPCPETPQKVEHFAKPFSYVGGTHKRLSMWSPNPYAYAARPAPDNDLSLLG